MGHRAKEGLGAHSGCSVRLVNLSTLGQTSDAVKDSEYLDILSSVDPAAQLCTGVTVGVPFPLFFHAAQFSFYWK